MQYRRYAPRSVSRHVQLGERALARREAVLEETARESRRQAQVDQASGTLQPLVDQILHVLASNETSVLKVLGAELLAYLCSPLPEKVRPAPIRWHQPQPQLTTPPSVGSQSAKGRSCPGPAHFARRDPTLSQDEDPSRCRSVCRRCVRRLGPRSMDCRLLPPQTRQPRRQHKGSPCAGTTDRHPRSLYAADVCPCATDDGRRVSRDDRQVQRASPISPVASLSSDRSDSHSSLSASAFAALRNSLHLGSLPTQPKGSSSSASLLPVRWRRSTLVVLWVCLLSLPGPASS